MTDADFGTCMCERIFHLHTYYDQYKYWYLFSLISFKLTMVMVGGTYPNPNPNPSAPLKQVMGPVFKIDA